MTKVPPEDVEDAESILESLGKAYRPDVVQFHKGETRFIWMWEGEVDD